MDSGSDDDQLGGIPRRLGPCRLLELLGSGGAGSVYLADLVEETGYAPAGSRVAIKVLHTERTRSQTVLRRFLREAELGRALDHPSVVRCYDVGQQDAGGVTYHYLIQEFVEGKTLRDLMRQLGVLPEALLQDLALQIARGLVAIHQAGATHRDLKPGNVLITPDYQVKLMDLGVAYLAEAATQLTRQGYFVGTLMYAAPEQVRGDGVTAVSDLYSLGVMLYEGATTVQPFDGPNAAATMQRVLSHEPPTAGQLSPQLTDRMDAIIGSLMAKRPGERFSDAEQLVRTLEEGETAPWWQEQRKRRAAGERRSEFQRIRVNREATFVGRFTEKKMLSALYRDAMAGRGQTLLLEGEAGVGKSRLLDELVRQVTAEGKDLHLLYGSNPPGRLGGASGAMTQAVLDHFGKSDLETKLECYLHGMPRLLPGFAAHLMGAPAPADAEPLSSDSVHNLFGYLASVLAAEKPLVWIVEDLHFASSGGRGMFLTLAREVHKHPIFLIGTSRPDLPAELLAHLESLPSFHRQPVSRLPPRQVEMLLARALHSDGLAQDLSRKLTLKSDGNPFFILEIIRELKERGLLRKDLERQAYTLDGALTELFVPASVRELLQARLDDLTAEDRKLLDLGAVQGFEFDADLIAQVQGTRRLRVLEGLAEIERRTGVIRSTGAGFHFDHHQLQEVIYASLPTTLRVAYHAELAEAYEKRETLAEVAPESMSGQDAVFLSVHYLKGDRGPEGRRTLLRALDYLGSRYQNELLLELADQALDQPGSEDPSLRCEVRLIQAEYLDLLARRDDQRIAVMDARFAARESGDSTLEIRADQAHGRLLTMLGKYDEAIRILKDSLHRASELAHPQLEAASAGLLGIVYTHLGEASEALSHQRRQLQVIRTTGDRNGRGKAALAVATGTIVQGGYSEAEQLLKESIEAFSDSSLSQGFGRANALLAYLYRAVGEYEDARDLCEKVFVIARDTGYKELLCLAYAYRAAITLDEGDLKAAGDDFVNCWDQSHALNQGTFKAFAAVYLANFFWCEGNILRAEEMFAQAEVLREEEPSKRLEAELSFYKGRFLLSKNDHAGSIHHFQRARDLTSKFSFDVPGILPSAYLCLLGKIDSSELTLSDHQPIYVSAEALAVLYKATGDVQYSENAHARLARMSRHLTPSKTSQFWSHNTAAQQLQSIPAAQLDSTDLSATHPIVF